MSGLKRVLIVGRRWGMADDMDELIKRAFLQQGALVDTFDDRPPSFASLIRALHARSWVAPWLDETRSNQFVRKLKHCSPHLVLALSAEYLSNDALIYAKQTGATTVYWSPDPPWRGTQERMIPAFDIWAVVDATWHGWLKERGARRVETLPLAADAELHHPWPQPLTDEERRMWGSKVSFVGRYTPKREGLLARIADERLGIWGPGWEQCAKPEVRRCVRQARRLRREEWLKVYAAAQVVINVNEERVEGSNLRVWEALCSAACLLTNESEDARVYLERLVETFKDEDDLPRKLDALLRNEARRNEMKRTCRETIVAYHTFRHRADVLLDWAAHARPSG